MPQSHQSIPSAGMPPSHQSIPSAGMPPSHQSIPTAGMPQSPQLPQTMSPMSMRPVGPRPPLLPFQPRPGPYLPPSGLFPQRYTSPLPSMPRMPMRADEATKQGPHKG